MLVARVRMLVGALALCPAALLAATLSAPVAVSPSGVQFYQYTPPNISFVWDQFPAVATPSRALPSHFLFCLQQPCTHANAEMSLLPGQLTSSPLRNPSLQIRGYRYFYTPTLPDSRLDVLLSWSVAGCTSNADSSCAASTAISIVASTPDVNVTDVHGNAFNNGYTVDGYANNLGSRTSPPFAARLETWEVLKTPAPVTACQTDPNDTTILDPGTVYVIDSRGVLTRLSSIPRDPVTQRYGVSDVVALYQPGPFALHRMLNVNNVRLTTVPMAGLIGSSQLNVPLSTRPRAFASALYLDPTQQLYEVNLSNNVRVRCEVVQ